MTTSVDQLAAALVERADAVPETAALLAKIVLDASPDGDRLAALDLARSAYPSMFKAKAPAAPTVPVEESVTQRVMREHREAAARVPGAGDGWASAPITARVMREAGRL